MAKNFYLILLLLAALLLAIVFAALNPGLITLDLALSEVSVPKALALIVALGIGWLFGLLTTALVLLQSAGEKRRLRKSLSLAQAEVKTLRSIPIQDAD